MTTRVILVSHGLTSWNLEARVQGHTDVPLAPLGWEMAQWLSRCLARETVHAIYTSDLIRAVQTALPTAREKSLSIVTDPRLREGRSVLQERSPVYPTRDFPKEIETKTDVLFRMKKALSEMATAHDGKTVLVVSHGGAMEIFIDWLLETSGRDPSAYQGIRTALNRLIRVSGEWEIECLEKDHFLKRPY